MQLKIKTLLILKTLFIGCCLISCIGMIIIKIVTSTLFIQVNSLQYTNCEQFYQIKYTHAQISNSINTVMIIIACIIQLILIIKALYELLIKKPQKSVEIVGNKLFKLAYCLNSLTIIIYLSVVIQQINFNKENNICPFILGHNSLILILLSLLPLILKLMTLIVSFYLLYKYQSSKQQQIDDYSTIKDKLNSQKFYDKNSIQIRQMLLNQHQNPFSNDQSNDIYGIHGNQQFTKFIKNYQTRANSQFKKFENQNIFDQQNQNKFEDNPQRLVGLDDQMNSIYNRQKIQDSCNNMIQKLQKFGYQLEQRPYIQKKILTKKFKNSLQKPSQIKNNPSYLNNNQKLQFAQSNRVQQLNQIHQPINIKISQPSRINKNQTIQEDDQIQIIVNLDAAQQKTPQNLYKQQDLQNIQLDQIYYRQYIEKQKAQKQQKKKKILIAKKAAQQKRKMTQLQRLKCTYDKYLEQDKFTVQQKAQMREYASRTGRQQKQIKEQLLFHLKRSRNHNDQHDDMMLLFRDQIRQLSQQNELKYNRKRQGTAIYSNYGRYKQKKNPIQIIRGRGALK